MSLEDVLVGSGLWPSAAKAIISGYDIPYADPTGTANALVVSLPDSYSDIVDGDLIGVGFLGVNTAAVTVAVTLGRTVLPAQPIVKFVNGVATALAAGDISGQVMISRDAPGARWILLNPFGTASLRGTSVADSAVAGHLGEYNVITVATPGVALTTAVAANVTSMVLQPGDWDLSATGNFLAAATTSITNLSLGISLTTGALPTQAGGAGLGPEPLAVLNQVAAVPGAVVNQLAVDYVRLSIAVATTVYLVASCAFTVSTLSAFGTIRARRMR